MAISEAERLRARGAEVVLADGKTYRLIFDMDALAIIEAELGGLDELVTELNSGTWKGKRVTAITAIMVAALSHTGMKRQEIVKLLRFKDVVKYLTALVQAFSEAMPEPDEAADETPLAKSGANGSPGGDSTTSQPSPSIGQTPNFGG